jgi:hypothetical protein
LSGRGLPASQRTDTKLDSTRGESPASPEESTQREHHDQKDPARGATQRDRRRIAPTYHRPSSGEGGLAIMLKAVVRVESTGGWRT